MSSHCTPFKDNYEIQIHLYCVYKNLSFIKNLYFLSQCQSCYVLYMLYCPRQTPNTPHHHRFWQFCGFVEALRVTAYHAKFLLRKSKVCPLSSRT